MLESTYRVGDEGQPFTYEREDDEGEAVSLAGQTVTVKFLLPTGSTFERTASLDTGDLSATYLLDASDLSVTGIWFVEFHETGASFTDTTDPIPFYVGPRLSTAT